MDRPFVSKGLSTLDTQYALNRIEFSLSVSTLNAHSPNLDSTGSHNCVLRVRTKKGVARTLVSTINSERTSLGYKLCSNEVQNLTRTPW